MKTYWNRGLLAAVILLYSVQGTPISDENKIEEYGWKEEWYRTTADRVQDHGYPAETHFVETEDNYVIQMFRIPYSHKLENQDIPKPAILLQHGLTSCSDAWILSGPDDSLAFLLADAGYDVWMGNARGNKYSRNNTVISPNHPYFWRFSWHEIGVIDIPAMIDHILTTTGQTAIHYTGHSQGTTVYFVAMSERPEYNDKIKTAHMLAPVAFMGNMKTPLAKYTRRFVGRNNRLTRIIDTQEVMHGTPFFNSVYNYYCTKNSAFAFMCSNLLFLLNGDNNEGGNMNATVAAHLNETHPAGASTTQVLHYMQEYETGRFCQLDHGREKNLERYGQETPPDYDVTNISGTELNFYYGDADTLADPIDVLYLASQLKVYPKVHHMEDPTFAHGEFAWHKNVRELINEPIINACNTYEESIKLK